MLAAIDTDPPKTITIGLDGTQTTKSPASRLALWYRGRLATHTLCVADPAGGIQYRGQRYREISVEDAIGIASTPTGVTYLLQKDEFETREIKVGTYCRDVTALGVDSVEYRIQLMRDAVEVLALSNVDVVLAPEYFFSKESADLRNARWTETVHYTEAEYRQVLQMARACTERWPTILMVLGTALWIDGHGLFRNTCIIGVDGQVVTYDKKNFTGAEIEYARDVRCRPTPGMGYHEVTLGGYRVLVQVCADCLSDRPGGDASLYLLPACDLGGAMLPGIPIILCDGRGRVSKFMPGQTTVSFGAPVEDRRVWDVTIRRRRSS